jgi:hypothetical protein
MTHSQRLVFSYFIKKLSGFIFAYCKMLRNCCATLSKIYEQLAYLWKRVEGTRIYYLLHRRERGISDIMVM